MKTLKGISVSRGIAFGKIKVLNSQLPEAEKIDTEDTETEIKRFIKASAVALNTLQTLYEKVLNKSGEDDARIFSTQQMLVQDEDFAGTVIQIIESQKVNAEYAVVVSSKILASFFMDVDSDAAKAKSTDVIDIAGHIIRSLRGERQQISQTYDENVILVSDTFLPSQIACLDGKVAAVVDRRGFIKSHTSCLVRDIKIPSIIRIAEPNFAQYDGMNAAVNGFTGEIFIEPDEETIERLNNRKNQRRRPRPQTISEPAPAVSEESKKKE